MAYYFTDCNSCVSTRARNGLLNNREFYQNSDPLIIFKRRVIHYDEQNGNTFWVWQNCDWLAISCYKSSA